MCIGSVRVIYNASIIVHPTGHNIGGASQGVGCQRKVVEYGDFVNNIPNSLLLFYFLRDVQISEGHLN